MFRLNRDQVMLLAEFSKDLSLFFLAAAFTPLIAHVDNLDYGVIALNVLDAFALLAISLRLLGKK